ncbi:MAG: biotin transporter BioY [Desulfobacterales bacterium]|jgi:biotin transport system substrate-specific component|nr:biotin transporter BioY [Desulfobacterales bacterium]
MDTFETLRMTVFTALMAALIAAGAFIIIPVGPVPVVLQNLFVMVAGLLLTPRWAAGAVAIYLLAGCLGLPVFAGGTGGIGRLLGPTGGYLLAYLPAVILISWTHSRLGRKSWMEISALVLAAAIVYALGVSWLKAVTHMSWTAAVVAGMLPFLPGDVLKIAAALPIARTLRPIVEGQVKVKLET